MIREYKADLSRKTAFETLEWTFRHFDTKDLALASSMGLEDQVISHMALDINSDIDIFTLDTGRLFQETYDCIEQTNEQLGIHIKILFPNWIEIEEMTQQYGPNLFYQSIEKRKLCCKIRKIHPLRRRLKGLSAWICGLRREQSVTRNNSESLDWDEANQLVKINPIIDWSLDDVWNYVKKNRLPYNRLHDRGFPSIGCAPCTRAVKTGEDSRSGRWWWEITDHRECGLHRP